MFAIPGTLILLLFIYLRPQEFVPGLEGIPFLNLACLLALFGLVVDARLRIIRPVATPTLIWCALFVAWVIVTVIVKVPPAKAVPNILEMVIAFLLYFIIAHSVQTFRGLELVAGFLVALCLFLAVVGVHQGQADTGCVVTDWRKPGEFVPDGRACNTGQDCTGPGAEPGVDYECEHIGLFGTTSHDHRVRYRGVLQDPNEVALTLSAGLSMLLAFAIRRRKAVWSWLAGVGLVLIFLAVMATGSRGGQLEFLLVVGIPVTIAYGKKALIAGGVMVLPLLLLKGGRSGEAADESTMGRYEAWADGLNMFRSDPIFGVGQGMFTEHHVLTAHNSYVLAFSELGFIGYFLWTGILYVSIKILLTARKDFLHDENARVVRVWSIGLLGCLGATMLGMLFLSMTYHFILWAHLGICSAFYSVVKRKSPNWRVDITLVDLALLFVIDVGFMAVLPFYLRSKGAA